MNPSGVKGWKGKLADRWDAVPIKGPMALAVGVLGLAFAASNPGPDDCSKDPLRHVYHPSRLNIIQKCAHVSGTVAAWRKEHDGDYHVSMVMDEPGWVNAYNTLRQHGYTVVEFVPGDGHPKFRVGQRLELVTTKVIDIQHGNHRDTGWIEGHPVFAVKDVDNPEVQRPNKPKLAPPTEDE